jgi:hypothetical protein
MKDNEAMTGFSFPEIDPEMRSAMRRLDGAIAAKVRLEAERIARDDQALARAALVERFPRAGRWLGEHPRALKLLFRLRPDLRPSMVYVQGKPGARGVRWPG